MHIEKVTGCDCDCDFDLNLLEPVSLDDMHASLNTSSVDLLSGFMMDAYSLSAPEEQPKQPQHRQVSFEDEPAHVILVPSFANDEEQWCNLWYHPHEIEAMRSCVREACRLLRKDPLAFPPDITRGLELRTSLDRQWRKHITLACIVQAQTRYPDISACHLAEIAHECTQQSCREATQQGIRDFSDAYALMESTNVALVPTFKLSTTLKNPVADETYVKHQGFPRAVSPMDEDAPAPRPAKRHCSMITTRNRSTL